METFSESLEKEKVVKAVGHLKLRARACSRVNGGAFEAELKKMKKMLNNEE